jgi:hypothetical protein
LLSFFCSATGTVLKVSSNFLISSFADLDILLLSSLAKSPNRLLLAELSAVLVDSEVSPSPVSLEALSLIQKEDGG